MLYLKKYKARGKFYYYTRRDGWPSIRLRGEFGSPEFHLAYAKWLAAGPEKPKERFERHTINGVVLQYFESVAYQKLAEATAGTYRLLLDKHIREPYGHLDIRELKQKHVRMIVAKFEQTPDTGNRVLSLLNIICRQAIRMGLIDVLPTVGVERLAHKKIGFRPWTESDVEAFRSVHQVGSTPRLLLELALACAGRRSDLHRLGWDHLKGDVVTFQAGKTGEQCFGFVTPELNLCLKACCESQPVFALTEKGKPFASAASMGNFFRKACNAAGLKDRSLHGIRKLAAIRAAASGATTAELMAVGGWRDTRVAHYYAQNADRERLAKQAAEKVSRTKVSNKDEKGV